MNRFEVKKEALRILGELGISEEAAVDIFYRQVVLNKGLPFKVEFPAVSNESETSIASKVAAPVNKPAYTNTDAMSLFAPGSGMSAAASDAEEKQRILDDIYDHLTS